jgi:outer membrane protein assembly factor BamB
MKKKYLLLLVSILTLSSLLSACAGGTGAPTSWPGLTVDMERETAYVAYNQHVYAVNLASGTEKWRFPQDADNKITFFAAPALTEDGQLIIGGYNHLLYSLDPVSGVQNWTYDGAENKYIASVLANGEQIFAPNSDNQLHALGSNGVLSWQFPTEQSLWGAPTSNGERVYLGSMDHRVYALDKASGAVVWKTEDLGGAIAGNPTLSPEGVLYVGTFANELIALDTADGRELWRTPTNNWVWSGPALNDDSVFFGDLSGTLYALNAVDGTSRWKVDPPQDSAKQNAVSNTPLVVEDTAVFVTNGGSIYAVNAETGTTRWSQTIDGKLYTPPVIAGDTILIAAVGTDALLYAYDLDGAPQWQFAPAK